MVTKSVHRQKDRNINTWKIVKTASVVVPVTLSVSRITLCHDDTHTVKTIRVSLSRLEMSNN